MKTLPVVALAGSLVLANSAFAAPIIYEAQCVATGSIGGQAYNNVTITVSVLADTDNIQNDKHKGKQIFANLGAGTIEIPNFEATIVAHISSPINVVANHSDHTIYFSADAQNGISVVTVTNKAFAHYKLQKDIGPIDGTASFTPGFKFPTSAGNFTINSIQGDMCSFSAVVE